MAEVRGLQKFVSQLAKLAAKRRKDCQGRVTVSFTASYAVHVHEDLEAVHRIGQAKFLEQPMRTMTDDGTFGKIIADAVSNGRSISEALLLAGLRLQREAQLLVPVNTGALRGSAVTTLEMK
jgi:hypothetical protein